MAWRSICKSLDTFRRVRGRGCKFLPSAGVLIDTALRRRNSQARAEDRDRPSCFGQRSTYQILPEKQTSRPGILFKASRDVGDDRSTLGLCLSGSRSTEKRASVLRFCVGEVRLRIHGIGREDFLSHLFAVVNDGAGRGSHPAKASRVPWEVRHVCRGHEALGTTMKRKTVSGLSRC